MYLPEPRYDVRSKVIKKKTLIFDLDETMIHCLDERDYEFTVERPDFVVGIPIEEPD